MRKMILICIAMSLALSMHSAEYKAFDGKKVSSVKGIVGLHDVEGKIYMEIPRSLEGKRLLTGTVVEECSDMLESNIGYQPVEPYIVSFQESNGALVLNRLNGSYNLLCEDNNLSISNINTIEKVFEIKEFSSDSSSVLIDAIRVHQSLIDCDQCNIFGNCYRSRVFITSIFPMAKHIIRERPRP